jgi:hypothetical protein
MKAIEAFFNAIVIGAAIVIVALGALFVAKGGEVHTYEKSTINNIAVPLHAMVDGKTHHMFENKEVILDISYNK